MCGRQAAPYTYSRSALPTADENAVTEYAVTTVSSSLFQSASQFKCQQLESFHFVPISKTKETLIGMFFSGEQQ